MSATEPPGKGRVSPSSSNSCQRPWPRVGASGGLTALLGRVVASHRLTARWTARLTAHARVTSCRRSRALSELSRRRSNGCAVVIALATAAAAPVVVVVVVFGGSSNRRGGITRNLLTRPTRQTYSPDLLTVPTRPTYSPDLLTTYSPDLLAVPTRQTYSPDLFARPTHRTYSPGRHCRACKGRQPR